MKTKPKKLLRMSTPVDLRAQVLASLPTKMECPHCHEPRKREEFGVRTVERDRQGNPTKVIRQSWCQYCRAGYPAKAAKLNEPVKVHRRRGLARKNGALYAGLERETHIYRFDSKKDLKAWLAARPMGRVAIEKTVVH